MNLKEILDREILPLVEQPSRYLGNEVNTVHKDLDGVELRLALIFPDLYDLGLGNLGLHILYAILNRLPWCWAERAYAPAIDMENELRKRDLPLFAVESKDDLSQFDGLGFTLQSELTYTNILNLIQLSGIPLRTKDRSDSDPLTFAGGPSVFNPEPLSPFMDFLVIGDGEDIVLEIAECMRETRDQPREVKLEALSKIEGIYVPALYPMETMDDGRILPALGAKKIVKRITKDLNGADFPTDYIVPFTQQIHDRVSLEVLRGCTQGCRFCQAGMTTRPVRERSLENVDALMQKTLDNTGYEEVSLVSLSTCDYSRVRMLADQTSERAVKQRVSVSLPSLRLDSFSVDLADRVTDVRRSGLTFAPEAASPRLRAVINKWIPDEELLEMSRQAFMRHWKHVKLYFMIGLPTERDDDIEAIGDLTLATLDVGRDVHPKARVHTGVSTFVPKPFTPFQWAEQIGIEETERRQQILDRKFRGHQAIRFGRHESEETYIEGMLSRADRRAGDLLESAYRHGARFDGWREHRNFEAWQKAIEETRYDVQGALRERELDERLPWDHIDVMIPKEWFVDDWNRATQLKHANDCRHSKCHSCGVIDRERPLCAHMLRNAIQGRRDEKEWTADNRPKYVEPDPAQRLRFLIGRQGDVRFLSHLEFMKSWHRSLRRAKLPLSYSQGFHVHPKVSFSTAMPQGEESYGDFMDVILTQWMEPGQAIEQIERVLPQGFSVHRCEDVPLRSASLMSLADGFHYRLHLSNTKVDLPQRVASLLAAEEIWVDRRRKKSGRRIIEKRNIREAIETLDLGQDDDGPFLDLVTRGRQGAWARPREIISQLELAPTDVRIVKMETYLSEPETVAEVDS